MTPLTDCPDCGARISTSAPFCPKCGRPRPDDPEAVRVSLKIDAEGAWCPHCGNRQSYRHTKTGCFYWLMVILFFALPLILYPFLPRVWICRHCGHEWKA